MWRKSAAEYTTEYGNVSKQSIGAIQRAILVIEEQGRISFSVNQPGYL
jgi:hypothetical protein